ncbi:MAG: LD-carboxypeptidase [Rhodothermia bacterium]|nr:MAG: LD-carboxypeptidase [Rhodothermia bacterium]
MTVQKPAPLTRKSRVGIVMPASAPSDSSAITSGVESLRERGLQIADPIPEHSLHGYLGGTDEERTSAINGFLTRSDVTALLAVRGGYGVMRLLDAIDYDAARAHCKLLVGYSDITALQFALYTHAGWTSVQGPMVAVEWPSIDPISEAQFWKLCEGAILSSFNLPGSEGMQPVRTGTTEGVLLGGNLAAIVRLIGTPHLPALDETILFLEDIGEEPYRIDALLAQLRLAGVLDTLSGVVLGAFTDCEPESGKRSFSTREVLHDYFSDVSYPVSEGLLFGHIRSKVSMPFGVRARLTVDESGANLEMLEAVVESEGV